VGIYDASCAIYKVGTSAWEMNAIRRGKYATVAKPRWHLAEARPLASLDVQTFNGV
jgi:hypothetical protein